MTKADKARQYRKKYGQEMPTLKLARIMYNENELLFKDVEDARFQLRYIEGKSGKPMQKHIKPEDIVPERPRNPYNLPESFAKEIPPYVLQGHKRAFIINDVHLPYHDVEATTVALDWAKKEKPDAIVLNGDIIDIHQLSYFVRDPRKKDFAYELDQLRLFIGVLLKTFKSAKIYYKFGNHEIRYNNFLFQKAGELVGVSEFDLINIIKGRNPEIEVISDKTIIKLNSLSVIHGHELGRGVFNPVNAARGLHLTAKVSAVKGDCHKTSEHTEVDLNGNIKTTWSIGALCGLHPEYLPYNSWNHGAAICDLDSNGEDFEFRNKRIHKGKLL